MQAKICPISYPQTVLYKAGLCSVKSNWPAELLVKHACLKLYHKFHIELLLVLYVTSCKEKIRSSELAENDLTFLADVR